MPSIQYAAAAPYLPWIFCGLMLLITGFLLGYVFTCWMKRAQPSQIAVAARVAVAAPLLLVYLGSVVVNMMNPAYPIPMGLHALIVLIVATVFPKRFFKFGRDGYEFGTATSDDKKLSPAPKEDS